MQYIQIQQNFPIDKSPPLQNGHIQVFQDIQNQNRCQYYQKRLLVYVFEFILKNSNCSRINAIFFVNIIFSLLQPINPPLAGTQSILDSFLNFPLAIYFAADSLKVNIIYNLLLHLEWQSYLPYFLSSFEE